jgi:hypothetical protein
MVRQKESVKLIHAEPPKQRIGKHPGIISRACSKCGGDLGDRYGKQRYCLSCHAAYMREHRPKHRELSLEAKKKANCRSYANVYQRRGVLLKQPCVRCGCPTAEKHHPDYDKPLEVIWMCRECHLEHHKQKETTDAAQLTLFP